MDFWFCADDIKRCVSENKKAWILDWPVVPPTWLVKLGTNLTCEEVFAPEDARFQLQQRGAMLPRWMFISLLDMPIPRTQFQVPANPDSHKTIQRNSTICRNGYVPTVEHCNQWESASHMNNYQVMSLPSRILVMELSSPLIVTKGRCTICLSPIFHHAHVLPL